MSEETIRVLSNIRVIDSEGNKLYDAEIGSLPANISYDGTNLEDLLNLLLDKDRVVRASKTSPSVKIAGISAILVD